MPKHAKVLELAHVRRMLSHVQYDRNATRNCVIILLSFKAGLRAAEIAGLDWEMAVQADGKLDTHIHLAHGIAKYGSGRRIPLNPELRRALAKLHRHSGHPSSGPVIRSERGTYMTPRSIVNWFTQLYRAVGLSGCSSHSGRRTFITRSARLIWKAGGSLRDIQMLVGHRSIETTQAYIEGDWDAQRRLVRLI